MKRLKDMLRSQVMAVKFGDRYLKNYMILPINPKYLEKV